MKTDDLILALSADAAPRGPSLRRRVALGLAIGALVSLAAFMSVIGPLTDPGAHQRFHRDPAAEAVAKVAKPRLNKFLRI